MTSSSPTRRRTFAVVAAAAAGVLLAAGCTSAASADNNATPDSVVYEGGQTGFGQSFTYADGLIVEVKKPVEFTPTLQAEGLDGVEGDTVKVRISIINGTDEEFTPDTLGVTVTSDGQEAVQIIDPGSRIDLTGPAHPLDRSGVAAFDLAFVVADVDDVTLSLVPALLGYDPLVVTAG
ncbi:hypothetical protein [Cellulomonas sp. S1-8]|uniref:hypothetical protein n=1 Tax=Cellulomonas sp. S1-8 TaxID=2904790 RepID=UPI0022431795|nr:hypothetical protein [Cellulomonas sp. S1-8]UZN03544.1 hypothetical protein OKX07_00945 [Cellulomonas sp. S1-8]